MSRTGTIMLITTLVAVMSAMAGYYAQTKNNFRYFSGYGYQSQRGEDTSIQLFNGNQTAINYSINFSGNLFEGTLEPMSYEKVQAPVDSLITLSSDLPIIAWKTSKEYTFGPDFLEQDRTTVPFKNQNESYDHHLLPWMSYFSTINAFDHNRLAILNTSPFTAFIDQILYNSETGQQFSQPSFAISPLGAVERPAITAVPRGHYWSLVHSTNSASIMVNYESSYRDVDNGNYSYWSIPTSPFSAFQFMAEGGGEVESKKRLGATSPFSQDFPLVHSQDLTSEYLAVNHEIGSTFNGSVTVSYTNNPEDQELFNLQASTSNAVASISSDNMVADPQATAAGAAEVRVKNLTPAAVMRIDGGNSLSVVTATAAVNERAVFPLDGRESWDVELAASNLIVDNKTDQPRTIATALIDTNGNFLNIEYHDIEPGPTEFPVANLVDGFPDTRTLLIETDGLSGRLSADLIVSGESGQGTLLDHIQAANANGCRTIGLAPEVFNQWGNGHFVDCLGQYASVTSLIELTNRGYGHYLFTGN